MTLATILFLLGILIIISKCDPFLGFRAPPRGLPWDPWAPTVSLLAFIQTLTSCLVVSICLLTGKKVKCRKADSRSERSGSSGEREERGGSSLGCRGISLTEGLQGPPIFPRKPVAIGFLDAFLSGLCFRSPTCKSCKSELPSSGEGEEGEWGQLGKRGGTGCPPRMMPPMHGWANRSGS